MKHGTMQAVVFPRGESFGLTHAGEVAVVALDGSNGWAVVEIVQPGDQRYAMSREMLDNAVATRKAIRGE